MNWIKKTLKKYSATLFITVMVLFILESISSIAYYQLVKPVNYNISSTIEAILKVTGKPTSSSQYKKLVEINKKSSAEDMLYPNYLYEPQFHHPREFYSLSNIANSRIIGCDEAGYFNYWKSDEFGFRNPAKTYETHSDILLIGDSFTEGACENEMGTIAGYLRSSGLKVANIGKTGSGPLYQLATLVEYAPVYKNNKVVWIIFTANDLRNLREEKTTQLSAYLDASYSQQLVKNSEKVNKQLKGFLEKQISNSNRRMKNGLPLIVNTGYGESLDLIDAESKESFILREVASRILTEVKKIDSELKIVILNHHKYDKEIQELTSKVIKEFAVSRDIDYLEISREYLNKNKSMYTERGMHFNKDGYRAIGEEIRAWLDGEGNKVL